MVEWIFSALGFDQPLFLTNCHFCEIMQLPTVRSSCFDRILISCLPCVRRRKYLALHLHVKTLSSQDMVTKKCVNLFMSWVLHANVRMRSVTDNCENTINRGIYCSFGRCITSRKWRICEVYTSTKNHLRKMYAAMETIGFLQVIFHPRTGLWSSRPSLWYNTKV